MPTKRVLKFKTIALSDPRTYLAMLSDQVQAWSKLTDTEAEINDERDMDFPALREHFKQNGYSCDFYSQRTNDGDHLNWEHTRAGVVIMTNAGNLLDDAQPYPTQLEELQR